MNHNQIIQFLDAYIDNQLNPTLSQDISEHIKRCQSCRDMVQQRQNLISLMIEHTPYISAREDQRERIIQHIKTLRNDTEKDTVPNPGLWLIVGIILVTTQIYFLVSSIFYMLGTFQPSLLLTIPFTLLPWYINLAFSTLGDLLVSNIHIFRPQIVHFIQIILQLWHPSFMLLNLSISLAAISLVSLLIILSKKTLNVENHIE